MLLLTVEELTIGKIIYKYSPGYPDQYPNNAYNLWDIRAPEGFVVAVSVLQLDVEEDKDFIHVGDGVDEFRNTSDQWKHLTGRMQGTWLFTSTSSEITIIFTSDGTNMEFESGFVIQCEAGKFQQKVKLYPQLPSSSPVNM